MPGLFRKPVKPRKSMFALAVVIAVGLSFEFVQGVWLEVNVNLRGHIKSGQRWSLQNRPTESGLGLSCFTPPPPVEASLFSCANSVDVNGRHVNFLTLPLYWLLWNVLPLTFFGIGKLLQKQGR